MRFDVELRRITKVYKRGIKDGLRKDDVFIVVNDEIAETELMKIVTI